MTKINYKTRLDFGHYRESLFRKYLNDRTNWHASESGQNLLPINQQRDLLQSNYEFGTNRSEDLLRNLPLDWRDTYLKRLIETGKHGIPTEKRFEPDVACFYNQKLLFEAEIKSDFGNYPNITFCLSGYLWSVENTKKDHSSKIFVWDLGEKVSDWIYLFVHQVPDFTVAVKSGKGLKGSQTPHGLVSKQKLLDSNQKLSNLLDYYETIFNT